MSSSTKPDPEKELAGFPSSSADSHTGAAEKPSGIDARSVGRGGLAITFAKGYFIVTGLLQQILLPRVLGIDGYGALSSALSLASISYNPITTASIQSVSRALSRAEPNEQPGVLRKVLELHAVLALVASLGFFFLAPRVAHFIGAPHIVTSIRILSVVLFAYALYTPLIGALNARRSFFAQAGFDIASATLRTVGLVAGAYWLHESADRGVEGAAVGFSAAAILVLVAGLFIVGGGQASKAPWAKGGHAAFMVRLLLGQVLFNLLMQADLTLLRYFASNAAAAQNLPETAADPLVGAYRATQLFGFLPFQLLVSITFVIFPILAQAHKQADFTKVRETIETGLRIALILVGLMVSVISGLSGQLLRLVFPSPAPELAGQALGVLSLGLGAFAVFSVLVAILNSLGHERVSLAVTGLGVLMVGLSVGSLSEGQKLDQDLLTRVAFGTSLALFATALLAALSVRKRVGGLVRPVVILRTLVISGLVITACRQLPDLGPAITIAYALLAGLVYVVGLVATGALSRRDLEALRRVVSRS